MKKLTKADKVKLIKEFLMKTKKEEYTFITNKGDKYETIYYLYIGFKHEVFLNKYCGFPYGNKRLMSFTKDVVDTINFLITGKLLKPWEVK